MSIKLYNGVKFTTRDLNTIHKVMTSFRDVAVKAAYEELYKNIAKESVEIVDRKYIGEKFEKEDSRSPLFHTMLEFSNRQNEIKKTGLRDPAVDFSFSVCVIPTKRRILGLHYTENETLRKLFLEIPIVKPYAYQNSTDRPKSVSPQEWSAREKIWNDALGRGVPAEVGYSYDIVPERMIIISPDTSKGVKKHLPNKKERVKCILSSYMFKKHRKKFENVVKKSFPDRYNNRKEDPFAFYVSCHTEMVFWLGEEEGKKQKKIDREELKKILPNRVTFKDINTTGEQNGNSK